MKTASCLLFGCLSLALTAILTGKELRDGMPIDKDQEDNLPDITDPAVIKTLKCGVCQASVMEFAFGINYKENEKGRKLKEVEIVEVMERVCNNKIGKYGLLLDQAGNPTQQWSNDDNVLRAKGGWVTRIAEGTCSDVYNEYEDYLLDRAPKSCTIEGNKKNCNTRPMVVEICVEGLKWCGVEQEPSLPPQMKMKPDDEGNAGKAEL